MAREQKFMARTPGERHGDKNDFLLSFFEDANKFEEKEISGFILQKWWNCTYWCVTVYKTERVVEKKNLKGPLGI